MRTRKAAQRSTKPQLRTDSKTGAKHRSHCVDPKTGLYRGRQVLSVTAGEQSAQPSIPG